ncbi:hypothetical protein ACRE1U_08380, partial [Helicobacter himalayensis]
SFTNIRESRDDSMDLKHFTLTNRTGNITQSLKQSLEIKAMSIYIYFNLFFMIESHTKGLLARV